MCRRWLRNLILINLLHYLFCFLPGTGRGNFPGNEIRRDFSLLLPLSLRPSCTGRTGSDTVSGLEIIQQLASLPHLASVVISLLNYSAVVVMRSSHQYHSEIPAFQEFWTIEVLKDMNVFFYQLYYPWSELIVFIPHLASYVRFYQILSTKYYFKIQHTMSNVQN